jgi:FKBP-type peptidyl-prolyl cis-trans isomerase
MKRGRWRRIVLLAGLSLVLAGCGNREMSEDEKKATVQASGLKILDVTEGSGPAARAGDLLSVHYTGTLASDGTQFDSSHKLGRTLLVRLGAGEVIKGWDEGLVGMKAGGKRKLFIPAQLAYGPTGRPPAIPPDADLVFELELVGIANLQIEDLQEGTGPAVKRGNTVSILYTGTITLTGKEYDSSLDRDHPFQFQVGAGRVLPGLDQGVLGMKSGGKRRLTIPAVLAFDKGGSPGKGVPPDADLIFELELLGIH